MRQIKYHLLLSACCMLVLFASCSRDAILKREVQRIELEDIIIKRYGQALFAIDTSNVKEELQRIQQEFKPFLDADLDDPQNITKIKNFISDSLVRQIYRQTTEQFPGLNRLEDDLTLAFKYIMYYFPEWEAPVVYSYVSGLMYDAPVKYSGRELVIALDMYLGDDYKMYQKIGIPIFQINRMNRDYLLADCINEIIRLDFITESQPNQLLDKMIEEGRILFLLDSFLPSLADEYKIGFTKTEIEWCRKNEADMWAYFIENELLFNSDPMIIKRFVNDGPFTAAFHRDSPARASLWLGWQIVKAYNNRDLTPADVLTSQNAREILQTSGYKPRRFSF